MRPIGLVATTVALATLAGCPAFREGPTFDPRPYEAPPMAPAKAAPFDVEIRDDRTDTWNGRYLAVPPKTGALQGEDVEVSSATVAVAIRERLYANLDPSPGQRVIVDVHRITTGWSTYELREVAFAAVDLDITITSSTGAGARVRATAWGRDGRNDISGALVRDVLVSTIGRAIDDAFCCDEPAPLPEPLPEAFRAWVSGPLDTWGWSIGMGLTYSGVGLGEGVAFPTLPGPQITSGFGFALETLVRLPLDGLRIGYGLRGAGDVELGPWKYGLAETPVEQSDRSSLQAIAEMPVWYSDHFELYAVGELGFVYGGVHFDTEELCQVPECHLRDVSLEGWRASGGIGVAIYAPAYIFGVSGLTFEAQLGVIRYQRAKIRETEVTTLDASDANLPTVVFELCAVHWIL